MEITRFKRAFVAFALVNVLDYVLTVYAVTFTGLHEANPFFFWAHGAQFYILTAAYKLFVIGAVFVLALWLHVSSPKFAYRSLFVLAVIVGVVCLSNMAQIILA